MDKPISLSVKDYIIRKMAVKMMLSEKVIEAVVNHHLMSVNEAFNSSVQHHSIEIGGLGKFKFNVKKAEKKLNKYLEIEKHLVNKLSICQKESYIKKLESVRRDIAALKPKLEKNEITSDLRGVEEQLISSREIKTGDTEGVQREDVCLQRLPPPFKTS